MTEPTTPNPVEQKKPLVFGRDDPPEGTESQFSEEGERKHLLSSRRLLDASRRFTKPSPPPEPATDEPEGA